MPLRRRHTDENNRPPLDKGGLQGVVRSQPPQTPPDPLLVQGGGVLFSEKFFMPLRGATTYE